MLYLSSWNKQRKQILVVLLMLLALLLPAAKLIFLAPSNVEVISKKIRNFIKVDVAVSDEALKPSCSSNFIEIKFCQLSFMPCFILAGVIFLLFFSIKQGSINLYHLRYYFISRKPLIKPPKFNRLMFS